MDWRHDETRQGTTVNHGEETSAAVPVPGLTILAHPDPRRIGERLLLPPLALGYSVSLSRLKPAFQRRGNDDPDRALPLADRALSRRPIRLLGDASGAVTVDVQDSSTAVTVAGVAVDRSRSLDPAEIRRGVVLVLGRRVVLWLHPMLQPPVADTPSCGLVGDSDSMVALRQEILRLAPLQVPVLLRGESGTGKELAARALHDQGRRRNRPFVAVNMATLTPTLAAAELFGAVRGAFTGADRTKNGLFQAARHGTLFLDEIGETPVEVQAMLLRALESEEILPVGGVEPQRIDVRVIAATDARLEEATESGRFRAPLYHRLAGYTVHLPSLRERLDDLGLLLRVFLEQEAQALRAETADPTGTDPVQEAAFPSAEIVARLAHHPWPGNVRELRNVARRLALLGGLPRLQVLEQLEGLLAAVPGSHASLGPPPPQEVSKPPENTRTTPRRRRRDPAEVSEEELLECLETHAYRMRMTAEALGLSRIGLYRRLADSPNVRKAADLELPEIEAAVAAADGDLEAAALSLRVSLQGLKRQITALGRSLR